VFACHVKHLTMEICVKDECGNCEKDICCFSFVFSLEEIVTMTFDDVEVFQNGKLTKL